ncbi:MAG TPA: TfoX/Sxy family protein [Gammaproteobacteria bacterium]|jgi:TfoX/Sxy family transcriptional regulator of competence genes|nr:TfoX/Sxy family protein [Gammaproteobacteria bacterium]
MAADPKTLERVRRTLARRKGVVEKRMVGGSLGFMVQGKLCVSVGEGRILVRVAKEDRLKLLKKPGAKPMKMGGRTLGGFIFIEPAGYRTDAQLKSWISQSLDVIAALPAKTKPKRKR